MKRSEAVKLSVGVYLAADKCVDTPRLFWFCCDRQKDKFADTCAFSLSEQPFACSDTGRRYTVEVARGIGCLFCDFYDRCADEIVFESRRVLFQLAVPVFDAFLILCLWCQLTEVWYVLCLAAFPVMVQVWPEALPLDFLRSNELFARTKNHRFCGYIQSQSQYAAHSSLIFRCLRISYEQHLVLLLRGSVGYQLFGKSTSFFYVYIRGEYNEIRPSVTIWVKANIRKMRVGWMALLVWLVMADKQHRLASGPCGKFLYRAAGKYRWLLSHGAIHGLGGRC